MHAAAAAPRRVIVTGTAEADEAGEPIGAVPVVIRICEVEAGLLWLVAVNGREPVPILGSRDGKAARIFMELLDAQGAPVPTG